jgi:metal-dependent amidase/aminoacylase/carboxypeptidase family protein
MDAVEKKILAAVAAHRETLVAVAQDIGAHAEPGFFETRTAARVAELLRGCGLSPQTGLARTGVKAVLQGGAPGPCAAVIGELDGILCPAHPAATPENGVAHACGHNAQLTALVGAALALSEPGGRGAFGQRGFCRSRQLICPHRHAEGAAKEAWNSAAANPNCCHAASTAWTLR